MEIIAGPALLSDLQVRRRYGVSAMTLWRWDNNKTLGFPKAVIINGRKYRPTDELAAWEASRPRGAGRNVTAA